MLYAALSIVVHLLALPWQLLRDARRGTSWSTRLYRWTGARWQEPPCDLLLHAVSMGEVVAMSPLVRQLEQERPDLLLHITVGTEGGLQHAQRLFPKQRVTLLPGDLPWGAARLVRRLQPRRVILVEGDVWPGMLRAARRLGARCAIVSAKCSTRSWEWWRRLSVVARWLFAPFDLLLTQHAIAQERLALCAPTAQTLVTGNLKYDVEPPLLTEEQRKQWQARLDLKVCQRLLLVGSTHPGEELLLLQALQPLWSTPGWRIALVPRHPARQHEIFQQLQSAHIPVSTVPGPIQLVAELGILTQLMQLSEVVILGGSFVTGIGGHNLLEPVQCGAPVLFGPHCEGQKELVEMVLQAAAGEQVAQLSELAQAVERWAGEQVALRRSQTPLGQTWEALQRWLPTHSRSQHNAP